MLHADDAQRVLVKCKARRILFASELVDEELGTGFMEAAADDVPLC